MQMISNEKEHVILRMLRFTANACLALLKICQSNSILLNSIFDTRANSRIAFIIFLYEINGTSLWSVSVAKLNSAMGRNNLLCVIGIIHVVLYFFKWVSNFIFYSWQLWKNEQQTRWKTKWKKKRQFKLSRTHNKAIKWHSDHSYIMFFFVGSGSSPTQRIWSGNVYECWLHQFNWLWWCMKFSENSKWIACTYRFDVDYNLRADVFVDTGYGFYCDDTSQKIKVKC